MSWLNAIRNRYLVAADPLRTQRRIELVVLLLGLLLCLQLAYGGLRLAILGLPGIVEPAADSMRVAAASRYAGVAADERDEILARPLFWPTRRPVVDVASAGKPETQKASSGDLRQVKQVGVFGSGDEAGIIALVNGKKRRILLGEEVSGWTLESIGSTDSEFANGARRETLALQRGNVTAAPRRAVKARIDISSGAGAASEAATVSEAASVKEAASDSAAVRDTDDSLSLGAGGSRR